LKESEAQFPDIRFTLDLAQMIGVKIKKVPGHRWLAAPGTFDFIMGAHVRSNRQSDAK
jgi:hypothetical protein